MRSIVRSLSFAGLVALACALIVAPQAAWAVQDGTTRLAIYDQDQNGHADTFWVDWEGDAFVDEEWTDSNENGAIDGINLPNTATDAAPSARSSRAKAEDVNVAGTRVTKTPLAGGGRQVAIDWNGDGRYDEVWWDFDGDGVIDAVDIFETTSKLVDNTKSTRFRGVFVGANNGLKYAEDDAQAMADKLKNDQSNSWQASGQTILKGAAATKAAIKAAIDAAKAASKPGDEFVFFFSGHGGGYDKNKGYAGGRLDADGDETNQISESDLKFDGSGLQTPPAGSINYYSYDLDGDGNADTAVVKDDAGNVSVWRKIGGDWERVGEDDDGDGDVDAADGGVDLNGDGDTTDKVAFDDAILVGGGATITDDELKDWLSGFPESCTLVVILDSCYSGSFSADTQSITDKDGKKIRPGHLEVITGAPPDGTALERPISHGVLTKGLLDALSILAPLTGHATSVADRTGDRDDLTTSREAFSWAGAAANIYGNLDNDSDGLTDEDGPEHGSVTSTGSPAGYQQAGADTTAALTSAPTTVVAFPGHLGIDNDGDLETDEDPGGTFSSYLEVRPVFDFTGARDGSVSFDTVWSGIATPQVTVPGRPGRSPLVRLDWGNQPLCAYALDSIEATSTLRLGISEVMSAPPAPPSLFPLSPPVKVVVDLEQTRTPGLGETSPTVPPSTEPTAETIPIELVSLSLTGSLPLPGLGETSPTAWSQDASGGPWQVLPAQSIDPTAQAVRFPLQRIALGGTLLGLFDTTPSPNPTAPPDPPRRLVLVPGFRSVTTLWSPSTDPSARGLRILRGFSGFASGASDASQTVVVDTSTADPPWMGVDSFFDVFFEVSDPPTRTTYYTAFASDAFGNWSSPVTATAEVPTKKETSVTIAASASTVSYLGSVTITGSVMSSGTPVDTTLTVALQRRKYGASTWTHDSTQTYQYDALNRLVRTVKLSENTEFRWRFGGDATYTASVSPVRRVQARAYMPVGVARYVSGRTLVTWYLYGRIYPQRHSLLPTTPMYIERFAGGRWRSYRTVWARNRTRVGYVLYDATVRLPGGYSYRWRGKHADTSHATTYSPWRIFRR